MGSGAGKARLTVGRDSALGTVRRSNGSKSGAWVYNIGGPKSKIEIPVQMRLLRAVFLALAVS